MRAKINNDFVIKDRVLKDFETTCEKVGAVALLDVKQDSPLVRAVDRVLQHGLREPVRGYWNLVRSLTHPTTLKALEAFVKYISSSHQKGLAWTLFTMEEGSLEFYLSSLLLDPGALSQHYLAQALLRDPCLAQRVICTISNLRAGAMAIQASMESSLVSEGPLDCPPSLTSPVDSGVALIDSDSSTSDGEKNEEYRCQSSGPGQAWTPVLGSSVNTEVSTSSDNTIADDNQNSNTIQPTKPSLAPSKYDGVCRRPRKKKKSESGKRVSFHQDSNDDSETGTQSREPYNMNRFYIEGRNSWAGEGDSYFLKEKTNFRQVKSEIYENRGLLSGVSIFESEMGIEADCDSSTTTLDETRNNIEIVCEKLTNVVKQSLGLKTREKMDTVVNINRLRAVEERGAPEGQEDPGPMGDRSLPALRSSVDLTSDSEWSLDTPERFVKRQLFKSPGSVRSATGWPARILQEAPSKTSLVKRFLRSIPTKKPYQEKKKSEPSLYIRGVKPDSALSEELLQELEEEMRSHSVRRGQEDGEGEVVSDAMATALRRTVLLGHSEAIYKVYRVSSTEGVPLLAVLTDTALYMTGLDSDLSYSRRHHISYHTLDTVLIGPEYQTLMLVSVDRSVRVTVISALGRATVCDLLSHLAVAATRLTRAQPSVCQLHLSSMAALRRALLTNTSVTKEEELQYYRYVRVEDSAVTGGCGPLGPTKCGHLMYRSHHSAPWLPGYIVLKGGVLYVFGDSGQQPPSHILPLHRGYFAGCRRAPAAGRPHAFEVLPVASPATFQFAAADDYESSDWLQAFIETSSTMCGGPVLGEGPGPLVGCGLLLTSRHLVTLDFPDQVLSCARLQDICAVRTATTCCVLETSCREVQQHGGDWVLYFLTEQAITEFLDTLCRVRPELKQVVSKQWDCKALHRHCLQTSQLVRHAWDPLLLPNLKQQ